MATDSTEYKGSDPRETIRFKVLKKQDPKLLSLGAETVTGSDLHARIRICNPDS